MSERRSGTVLASTVSPEQRFLMVELGGGVRVLAFAEVGSRLVAGDAVVLVRAGDGTFDVADG